MIKRPENVYTMYNDSEYICLDKLLSERMSAGKPIMPDLIPYFDDDFFDIYAGCFNAMQKPINCGDEFELHLARLLLREALNGTGKSDYKVLLHIIDSVLNM